MISVIGRLFVGLVTCLVIASYAVIVAGLWDHDVPEIAAGFVCLASTYLFHQFITQE